MPSTLSVGTFTIHETSKYSVSLHIFLVSKNSPISFRIVDLPNPVQLEPRCLSKDPSLKGVARIWFRGGHPFRGGPTPYFSPQTPNHKGPPLCTFGYPRISGGPAPPPRPPLATPLPSLQFHDLTAPPHWSDRYDKFGFLTWF